MRALLLNSGVGQRMGDFAEYNPKCMVPIGEGYTIISRQLTQIAKAGIPEAVVTVGPFADRLTAYIESLRLPIGITYVSNPMYRETNYIYSMYLAREHLHDDILLLHGDLVLECSVLSDLIKSPVSMVAVDSTLPLPQKDFKAKLKHGCVDAIGIEFFGFDCVASQPAYLWRQADFGAWMKAIVSFCASGQRKVYAENAFNAQNGAIPLYPMELNGRLCNEIDNPDDLDTISQRFVKTL